MRYTVMHPLHWGDWEMGTAISCTECSHMAGLIQKARDSSKAPSHHAAVLRAAVYERNICKGYVGGWYTGLCPGNYGGLFH